MPELQFDRKPSQVREAIDVLGPTIDPDDNLYRNLTQAKNRDLAPFTQDKMQETSLYLFRVNPLAFRILKLSTGFVASGDVTFRAEDNKVQKLLEEHWEHPLNDWENQLFQKVFELGLYGEQVLTVGKTPDNVVVLGYVSPLEIDKVNPDSFNSSKAGQLVLKRNEIGQDPKVLDVITYKPDLKRRVGDTFFFTVNKVTDSLRGTSDLLPLADYLEGLDQMMFSLLERVAHLNSYIWDVKLTGATEEKVREFLGEMASNPPRPGGVRAHNELVEWTAVSPDLKADDNSEHARLYRNHILGGAGLAEWMFADSGGTGRATASEMAEPTYKSLITRQREVRGFLGQIFDFVIDEAIADRKLARTVNRKFSISLPKISLRDFQRTSGALYRSAQALELLVSNGLIEREKAVGLALSLIQQLDLESDIPVGKIPEMPKSQVTTPPNINKQKGIEKKPRPVG